MKYLLRFFYMLSCLLVILLCSCTSTVPSLKIDSNQAIVVKTADWNASVAVLQAYEREGKGSSWVAVGKKIPAVIGRNGMGWGAGIHQIADVKSEQVKKEGDGKAPAGIFRLGSVFGYEPVEMAAGVRMPYRQLIPAARCVDDSQSKYYNRIVDADFVKPDWSSSEEMLRKDTLYRFGIVIDHNVNPVIAGKGSCIFLHIWEGANKGTSGCTAVSAEDMEMLLLWLIPETKPIFVQLPEDEYSRVRKAWDLP